MPTRPSPGAQPGLKPGAFNIIRFAILFGLVLFGGVAWFMSSSGPPESTLDAETAGILRIVFYVFTLGVLAGLALLRQHVLRAGAPLQQRISLSIVGYALAESVGLFGAVYLFLTGASLFFLVGLAVLLVAFLLFPTPKD